jgi:hypothetical protein
VSLVKKILLFGILIAVFASSVVYLVLPPQMKLYYVLDDVHLAKVWPSGTSSNMTCPVCMSKMRQIVIDPDKPLVRDAGWRYAFYCEQDDLFWIVNFPGGISFTQWYGPFNAHWKLANILTISTSIISGTSVVLLALGTIFSKRNFC